MSHNRSQFRILARCVYEIQFLILCLFGAAAFTAMSGEPPPEFPRVHGDYQMTPKWRVTLPDEYAKRFEKSKSGEDLVLWRSGITCWVSVYNRKEGETPAETLDGFRSARSKDAIQEFDLRDGIPLRYGYLLREKPKHDQERWALYTLTFSESGSVLMAIYFDEQSDLETAKKIWFSITDAPK